MIMQICYTLLNLCIIILSTLVLWLHHSMPVHVIILISMYSKLLNYPQILVHWIIWSDCARFSQNYLPTYITPNKHKKIMQIVIGFHHVLILEIEHGYHDDTSRHTKYSIVHQIKLSKVRPFLY